MRLFAFGIGYSTATYLRAHARDWARVAGSVRTATKASRLEQEFPDLKAYAFDGTAPTPEIAAEIAHADALLVSVPPLSGDPALRVWRDAIASSGVGRIVYLSTLGVYGDTGGGWIDETTPADPAVTRGEARVAAENDWLALATPSRRVFVLRLAGIYGPGRNAIANLREGTARRIVKPGQVFNRIHVEDISRTIAACMRTFMPGGIVNVCDDEPAPPQDVIAYAADLVGVAAPPEIAFEQANLSPMAATFWATCKRVSNRKLREQLGVDLAYPTFREGLASLAPDG
ncbi:MAG: NAD(P)-dependent oxidoreductase [Rhodoblastus sp.]|nr:NAD(P)-dependent oxidoreductase [Rhodoblastus sp.]